VTTITGRRVTRVLRAVMPGWMLAAFAVCLVVPGPFDEIAMILAAAVLVTARLGRARSAWRGGKSHRAADATELPTDRRIP
jgi:hypothetical protein